MNIIWIWLKNKNVADDIEKFLKGSVTDYFKTNCKNFYALIENEAEEIDKGLKDYLSSNKDSFRVFYIKAECSKSVFDEFKRFHQ